MARKRKASRDQEVEVLGLLGIGLDDDEGHRRLTTGDNFVLIGGSEETHERMIDSAIHVNEALAKRGKTLETASLPEIIEIVHDVAAKQGK